MDYTRMLGRIYAQSGNGTVLAEITFPLINPSTVDINHTFVDPSLRGQGIADELMCAAVEEIRTKGYRAVATCSYAEKWFASHPENADLLLPTPN